MPLEGQRLESLQAFQRDLHVASQLGPFIVPQDLIKGLRLANGPAGMVVTQLSHLCDLVCQSVKTFGAETAKEATEELILPDKVPLQKVHPRVVLLIELDM